LQVSEVRIKKTEGLDGKVKGYATITFDGQFVVHNIRIVDGKDGLFIAMPCRKMSNGEYKDVVHPISTDFREYLKKTILEAFEKAPDAGQTN